MVATNNRRCAFSQAVSLKGRSTQAPACLERHPSTSFQTQCLNLNTRKHYQILSSFTSSPRHIMPTVLNMRIQQRCQNPASAGVKHPSLQLPLTSRALNRVVDAVRALAARRSVTFKARRACRQQARVADRRKRAPVCRRRPLTPLPNGRVRRVAVWECRRVRAHHVAARA